ncbi:MAG: MFS transporter, partial [Nocardiopsaceae bacterium]|nr:MFS transporter [Nocardiopsaceae bacterium]
ALALGLVGVGQVCGRLGYPALARRTSPATRTCAVLAAGAVTTMLLAVTSAAPALVLGAAVLAGASRGSYTLIQATAVSDRWGTAGFGTLNGIFTAPVTTATALAPSGGTLLAGLLGTPFAAYCLLASLIAIAAAVSLATR